MKTEFIVLVLAHAAGMLLILAGLVGAGRVKDKGQPIVNFAITFGIAFLIHLVSYWHAGQLLRDSAYRLLEIAQWAGLAGCLAAFGGILWCAKAAFSRPDVLERMAQNE